MKSSKTKSLGQHFLRDRSVLRKILGVISPEAEDFIIEIGAGKGVLTIPLALGAGGVIALEKDKALIPGLRSKNLDNLTILDADVLDIRFGDLFQDQKGQGKKIKIVGNLPYVISAPILLKVLEEKEVIEKCVFLLQKEVAQRISARPGTKSYAPLSIRLQIYFSVELCFSVKPTAFTPPPRVQSALVRLEKRKEPLFPIKNEESFSLFLKTAFRHRRKTLINNLVMAGYDRERLERICQGIGIPKNFRPEQISIPQFVELFASLPERGQAPDQGD
ncbi:MAG: ribosomal RNA small subunit methyltransferase A [Candidatus Aminicenantes bacterium]|nr:ribosomal RNA small subunit methyltransferase A [Candidatus Aminicenantes bacterium]